MPISLKDTRSSHARFVGVSVENPTIVPMTKVTYSELSFLGPPVLRLWRRCTLLIEHEKPRIERSSRLLVRSSRCRHRANACSQNRRSRDDVPASHKREVLGRSREPPGRKNTKHRRTKLRRGESRTEQMVMRKLMRSLDEIDRAHLDLICQYLACPKSFTNLNHSFGIEINKAQNIDPQATLTAKLKNLFESIEVELRLRVILPVNL